MATWERPHRSGVGNGGERAVAVITSKKESSTKEFLGRVGDAPLTALSDLGVVATSSVANYALITRRYSCSVCRGILGGQRPF